MKARIMTVQVDRVLPLPDGPMPVAEGDVLVVVVCRDYERALAAIAEIEAREPK